MTVNGNNDTLSMEAAMGEDDPVSLDEKCHMLWEMIRQHDVYFGAPKNPPAYVGVVITAFYLVVILFGACGNLLTFIAVIRNPPMRTNRNFFIFNLALSDFMLCVVTAPVTLYTILRVFWPFGELMCKFVGSMQAFNVFVSALSITAIGFDRYVVVIFPTRRNKQRRLMLFICASMWSVSLVMALPYFAATGTDLVYNDSDCGIQLELCFESNVTWGAMPISKQQYTIGTVSVVYLLPIFGLVFVYWRIAWRMKTRLINRRSNSAAQNTIRRRSVEERQRRTNYLISAIVLVFALSWAPLNIFHMYMFAEAEFNVIVFACCHLTGMTSACANPVIYGVLNETFRTEYLAILEKAKILPLYRRIRQCLVPCLYRLIGKSGQATIWLQTNSKADRTLAITNDAHTYNVPAITIEAPFDSDAVSKRLIRNGIYKEMTLSTVVHQGSLGDETSSTLNHQSMSLQMKRRYSSSDAWSTGESTPTQSDLLLIGDGSLSASPSFHAAPPQLISNGGNSTQNMTDIGSEDKMPSLTAVESELLTTTNASPMPTSVEQKSKRLSDLVMVINTI